MATAACKRGAKPGASLRFLTSDEAATLDAWIDVLIPADEQSPGARQTGGVRFIDRQLAKKLKRLQGAYRQALASVEKYAQASAGASFAQLSFEQRTALAESLEAGQAPAELFADGGKAAFAMVLAHTQMGYYGDPRHGGNQEYASWRMMGVAPMPARGRQHFTAAETYPERS